MSTGLSPDSVHPLAAKRKASITFKLSKHANMRNASSEQPMM
jgi:hypothetical protein